MRRLLGALFIAVVGATFFVGHTAVAQSTNNFRISSFNIRYELSRDSEGRSVLKTTELITAEFPESNQNHGLERAIPTTYNGHPVGLKLDEALNTDGNTKHSSKTSGDMMLVRIGDANSYVHGTQTYRISYTQHDVTRFYENTGKDEWYWNTNGTQWSVPIDRLSITISLSPEVKAAQTGEPYCYSGRQGATNRCGFTTSSNSTFTVDAAKLSAGENVTVAFGFNKGTFAGYQRSWLENFVIIWAIIQVVSLILGFIVLTVMIIIFYRKHNRTSEINPIVAEYIPPKETSVIVAAQITSRAVGSAFTALLIDLAVRRFIAIVETKKKSAWKNAEYDIVVTADIQPLLAEEKEVLSDMFDRLPGVDDRIALKSLSANTAYYKRTADNNRKITALVEGAYALRHKLPTESKFFYRSGIGLGVVGLLTLSLPLVVVAGITAGLGAFLRPLTDKGVALRRYVLGLDRYIRASEQERLAFLQGPDTAQKIGFKLNTDNPGEMVKLYERTLPYAILFGREKEWAKRLGTFYESVGEVPSWYTGSDAFNAVVFASAMNSISAASSYSSGSSSGSGGSGGGGFSGGGGGGGGGGGW